MQRERAAVPGFAGDADEAAMAAHGAIDDRQAEAAALLAAAEAAGARDRTCGRCGPARARRCQCLDRSR